MNFARITGEIKGKYWGQGAGFVGGVRLFAGTKQGNNGDYVGMVIHEAVCNLLPKHPLPQ